MHEFDPGDNGQHAGMVPSRPMTQGGAGSDTLLEILWRGRWLILLSVVLAAAGAYVYLQVTTPMYDSTSRILVEKPAPQPRSDAPQPVGSTLQNYLATQASLITSPRTIAAALRDPNVLALPTFADPSYVAGLVRTLSAEVGKKADVIQVRASSAHPEDAAQFVNAVVRAYTRWHEANRQLTTADLLKDLNSQLDNRYRELQLKRKEQMLLGQRYPEVVENTPGGVVSKTIDVLKQELVSARLAAVERDSYYQGLQRFEKEPETFRQYFDSHRVSATTSAEDVERIRLEAEVQKTRSELEEIQVSGIAQRSRITMLQNRQSELEEKIAELDTGFVPRHIALAKTLSEEAHAREKQLTDLYEKEFAKVHNLSEQDAQYAFLKSECMMMENMCNSLLSQINQLDLSARLEGLKIYVLEEAVPAGSPSAPQATRIIGIGLVLGLMVGAGLSFLRDWRDQRVRSADEITAILGVPVLGSVPSMSKRRVAAHGQGVAFAAHSGEAEAYRAICTSLFFGVPSEQAATILVTSPGPLEGKTTLVSNLGIAMAQAGQRTLIVDADLRKPMQHRFFATNGDGRGLDSVLRGAATLDEVIRPTEIPRLDVLASHEGIQNPSELLDGRVFAKVLEQVKQRYDRILFDSAPVGLVTDSRMLAAYCDLTVLVLRAQQSSRIPTQRARDALLTVRARLLGVIVNDVSEKDGRYSQYGFYGYYPGHNGSHARPAAPPELPATPAAGPENAVSIPETEKGDGPATQPQPPRQDPSRPESNALPLEIMEYVCKATRRKPAADAGPRGQNGTAAPAKKRNGRPAGSKRLSTEPGTPDPSGTSAPEKEKTDRNGTAKEPPTGAGPGVENGAKAAKKNGRKGPSKGSPPAGDLPPSTGSSSPEPMP
jgi:capsular exopolysaccharide synthesis family protein